MGFIIFATVAHSLATVSGKGNSASGDSSEWLVLPLVFPRSKPIVTATAHFDSHRENSPGIWHHWSVITRFTCGAFDV